ncbi:ATP-binding cassette domain-containing protein [Cytophagales bacterium LB-30]|uniref:ATP-binding cassette domain-containing protein n=1 Tax=Shiella aurantiaca TaxID=3058365 RepID=A0ABT8F990_9BACT|nr:ATP-binding cassette domain-containing protein [Shiella aurantiaca]MDN4166943.1 ATP-binding cassette domain-containing protein [Shiella aurantiaca]
MSEEILKALTQLFAIITKQDGGVTEKERNFVVSYFQQELDQDSVKEYLELYDQFVGYNTPEESEDGKKEKKLTSVRDSVKTLAICKKINKTLTQKQKVVVLIKILELVGSDKNFTPQRMEIIDTISTVFNIEKDEFKLIEGFVLQESSKDLDFENILIVRHEPLDVEKLKYVHADLHGEIIFMKVPSVDMYFVKYMGPDENVMNGFIMKNNQVYLFSHGSTIKTMKGNALYYSDLISQFMSAFKATKLSFNAINLEYKFPNGGIGLRNINISEGPGKLIGIMGASGAGKTTLLNVLAGMNEPSSGELKINGFNVFTEKDNIQGVIGYVAQDDLLIEELTVYQNLYYNAKLCFAGMSEAELDKRVMDVLTSLGLEQRKDLRVGSVLDKTISGGQRKRLNIALELIREPSVMFVDEPTSGLSSRDSENVIDLLKELTLKGKLIFVVIHQPSSDIYKMFDKMYIMDTGGYPIFYGNPVEAVTYFKSATNQVDKDRGQCPTCGNVNPEQIFNIIEAKVVDEYGQFTNKRKVNPMQWHEQYEQLFKVPIVPEETEAPPKGLDIPSKIKQTKIFTVRDTLAKISNKQYLLINLLEAPVLAIILAFIIRYKTGAGDESYVFRFNENIPAFLLMSIIVALFMGLSVSAEEIIRDRKILKRESFLNLSWGSYIFSKLIILFVLSAIQTLTYVIIGNMILEVQGMTLSFWLVLFTVSCFANVLGLNVSSAFNSAVTVYILIPLLLIPQMILSGLLFSFDKLNNLISTKGKVPIVADFMASRWAYEALAVEQFIHNDFEEPYYELEKEEMMADFKASYVEKKLREKVQYIGQNKDNEDPETRERVLDDLTIVKNTLERESFREGLDNLNLEVGLTLEGFSKEFEKSLNKYLDAMRSHYLDQYNFAVKKKETLILYFENDESFDYKLNEYKDKYYNESMADLVRNLNVKDRIIEFEGRLIQQIDPVFHEPAFPNHALDYRTHFFAPKKHFVGQLIPTFTFNMAVIWLMTIILCVSLYFELFKKFLESFGKIKLKK